MDIISHLEIGVLEDGNETDTCGGLMQTQKVEDTIPSITEVVQVMQGEKSGGGD